jgi:hypothetical protein
MLGEHPRGLIDRRGLVDHDDLAALLTKDGTYEHDGLPAGTTARSNSNG